jgi:HEPN domain-containing protein
MSPDPERCAEAREWLIRARHDLLAAHVLLGTQPALSDVAVYHCQQAAEKALKAFLFWHDRPFRKTHDLEELGAQCVALDASLDSLLDKTSTLTPYAWQFRYPGPAIEPTTTEAAEAALLAEDVLNAVVQRLPPEVNPESTQRT